MSKFCFRLTALILIPCLLQTTGLGTAGIRRRSSGENVQSAFHSQALAPKVVAAHWPRTPFVTACHTIVATAMVLLATHRRRSHSRDDDAGPFLEWVDRAGKEGSTSAPRPSFRDHVTGFFFPNDEKPIPNYAAAFYVSTLLYFAHYHAAVGSARGDQQAIRDILVGLGQDYNRKEGLITWQFGVDQKPILILTDESRYPRSFLEPGLAGFSLRLTIDGRALIFHTPMRSYRIYPGLDGRTMFIKTLVETTRPSQPAHVLPFENARFGQGPRSSASQGLPFLRNRLLKMAG